MTRRDDKGDLLRATEAAREARSHAYAPYSRYGVGAAVVTRAGRVYAGCNVENASFGGTLCAERSAVAAMIAAGDRDPVACVVVTSGPQPGSPCGICRQVLAEFARDMKIAMIAEDARGRIVRRTTVRLASLLPRAFRGDSLMTDAGASAGKRDSRKGKAR